MPGRLRRLPVLSVLFRALDQSSLVLGQRVERTSALGTLGRLWAWQVWRRTAARVVTIRCAEGSQLLAPSWSRVAALIAGTGLTERDDAIFVLDLLRANDLFVDVGANIGFFTVLAAGRDARVRAYEPTPEASAICEASVALNGRQALVTVHPVACGAAAGVTRFTTGLDVSNHIVDDGEPGIDVAISTLDEQLAGERPQLSMLKIDAEGHDLDVLKGALSAIERLQPVILVEIWTGGAGPLKLLEGQGYRPYTYDPATRSLAESAAGRRMAGNMLLVPDGRIEAVRQRVERAERPELRAPSVRWRRPASRETTRG
jgi:FkbM family methyltransferase